MGLLETLGLGDSGNSGDSSLTPESIELRRELAKAMLKQGQSEAPITATSQGLNRVAQSLLGAYQLKKLDQADRAGKKESNDLLASLFGGGMPAPKAMTDVSAAPPVAAVPGKPASGDVSMTSAIVGAESGGDTNATNPNSSATGRGQFIESTWRDLMKRYKPDLIAGKSDADVLNMRLDPKLSDEMTGIYTKEIAAHLMQSGISPTPGNAYLGYFLGPAGAVKALKADPSTPLSRLISQDAIDANPHLVNMTAGDVKAWADRKMGGVKTAQAAPGSLTDVGPMTAPAPASAAPAASQGVQATPQQNALAQKAILLMRNPRYEAFGQKLLLSALATETKDPLIVKVPGELGEDVSMVYDRASNTLKPISTLMGGQSAATVPAPASQSAAATTLPPFQTAPAAPQTAVPAPAPSAQNIGEVGPGPQELATQGALPHETVAVKGDLLNQPAASVQTAPPAPAVASDIPEGATVGPAWRGKLPADTVQRMTPDGRFLYGADRQPLLESKSAADARNKGTETANVKRAEAQIDAEKEIGGVKNLISSGRSISEQPGFAAGLALARAEFQLPVGGSDYKPASAGYAIARAQNPNNPAWSAYDAISQLEANLKLKIARPMMKGQGQVSNSERELIAEAVGNVRKAGNAADFQFRLNSLDRMIEDASTPGRTVRPVASYAPTRDELRAALTAQSEQEIGSKVAAMAKKYNVPENDMKQYVLSQWEFIGKPGEKAEPTPKKQSGGSSLLDAMLTRMGR